MLLVLMFVKMGCGVALTQSLMPLWGVKVALVITHVQEPQVALGIPVTRARTVEAVLV